MISRRLLRFEFSKRLPEEFGGGKLYVNPRADRRVLSAGWNKAAPDLREVARRFVEKGNTVWDVGSNLGIFAAFCAGKVGPAGRVYAVEPDPYYSSLIGRSIERFPSQFGETSVLCAAAADRVGIAQFSISSKGHAQSSLSEVEVTGREKQITVATVTLDQLADTWQHPNFIKIDVEGAECLVLKGSDYILSKPRPKIYIEVNPHNADEIARIFKRYDYSIFKLSLDGRDTSITLPDFYTIALPN